MGKNVAARYEYDVCPVALTVRVQVVVKDVD